MSSVLDPRQSAPADDFDPFAGGELDRVLAASEVQREVWLGDRLGTDASLAFNESVSLRLRGRLDDAALQAAIEALVQRHAMLRTTLAPDGGELLVAAPQPLALPVRDLRALSPAERDAACRRALVAAVETPFSLEQGPLFRAELLRLSADESLLLLTAHHIVCDGWSWGVIAEDLGVLYTECLGEGPAPEPADDYADYAAWAAAQTAGEAGAAAQAYWTGCFQGSSVPVLDLPVDRPRPMERSFASRRVDHTIGAADVQALQRTAGAEGVSLFAALLATFAATLQRLTGQDDVVVGVPAAGQSTSGLHALVGHCVNLLPVRLAPTADQPVRTLLAATGSAMLDAFEHATLSYGALLAKLPLQRDPSRLPLVSVMFNVDQAVKAQFDGYAGLVVELAANPRHFENFELFVNAARLADGSLRLECQYSTALFEQATVERWMRCYEALLRAIARAPETPLARLPMLAPEDRAALDALQPRFDTTPTGGLMHAAFERQCRLTPERVAAISGGETWRYAELDAAAHRIAHTLRARGVGRGDLVGLCLERGLEMLAALLGVLRAGAAYVPLDPSFPQARLDYYAEDARLALLITRSSVAVAPRAWRPDAAARVLQLDTDLAWRDAPAVALPPDARDAQPEDAAYVIYTSGSTGRPKGVVVPHRAVANFLAAMQAEPSLAPDDRLAAVTTLSFDIAVLELMLPLTVGACTIVVPRDTVTDAPALRALLQAQGATVMQATPGLWRMLVDAGWAGARGFRAFVGGEALPPDLARDLAARCASVWNLYGPTETTVWSTVWRVDPAARAVSIGRPIRNTTVWVLDEAGQPCPQGVAGELCIGGDGVTTGYLDRPELTVDRFIPDPFGPGERLYRTGDRGRWRHDGLLEHLGRLDFQVKVRGYRIELGEIEAACVQDGGASEAVVLAREDVPGDVRLVAYLVTPAAVDENALRQALRRRLPEYMLPQAFVALPALPRLPNGKIDRRALPAPGVPAAGPAESRREPRDEVERRVAETMQEVLRLPGIGIDDDFFALGGHSLLAARLTARLTQAFGVAVTMRALLQHPTIAGLAMLLRGGEAADAAPRRDPIVADPARRRAPLTPAQARMCFIEQMNPGRTLYHTPSAHRLHGPFELAAFRRAFQTVLERQPALRTLIAESGDGFEQQVQDGFTYELPLVDLAGQPENLRESLLREQMQQRVGRPLDIRRLPLFDACVFRMAAEDHVLFFMPHHIVWDGWSFDVFYAEIAAAYEAALSGQAVALPAPAVSFADYAVWQAAWLNGPECADQTRRWVERLAAAPVARAPQTDFPRRGGMSGRGATERLEVPAPVVDGLNALVRDAGVTLNVVALTIYAAMYTQVVRSPAVVVGVPVRGRWAPELESVMGFFNNLVLLAVESQADLPVIELARRVKEQLFDAMSMQELPFERLAGQPELARRQRGNALYQVLFSYQDAVDRVLDWGPLKHEHVAVFQEGATEDLGLWLLRSPSGLRGGVTFNADLYKRDVAELMRDLFVHALTQLAERPAATVGEVFGSLSDGPFAALCRLGAAAEPAAAPAPAVVPDALFGETRPAAQLDESEQLVAQVWSEVLGVPAAAIQVDSHFFSIGGSSLQAIQVVQALQHRLGRRVPVGVFANNPTLAELARVIEGRTALDSVVVLRDGDASAPLFLVHDGEGETLLYRQLAERLPPGQAVFGLQPLATEHAPLAHRTRRSMADYYVRRIREVQPQGPYRLGGLCAGGALAFEVALQLEQGGDRIDLLALLDANHWTAAEKPHLELRRRLGRLKGAVGGDAQAAVALGGAPVRTQRRGLAGRLGTVLRKGWGFSRYLAASRWQRLRNARRVRRLWQFLHRGEAPPAALRDLSFRQIYEVVVNDTARNPRLKASALLVRARQGDGSLADLPFIEQFEDSSFGWRHVVEGELTVIDVDGGHSTMLREPNVDAIAQAIGSRLKARPERG